MKTTITARNAKVIPFSAKRVPIYPNAMVREQKLHRLLDCALTIAASAGIATSLLVLFTVL